MLRIKFFRVGRKHDPNYRIIVAPRNSPKQVVELLGSYNPKTKNKILKKERILYWLSKGAKASSTLHNLLISEKVIAGKKIAVHGAKITKTEEVAQKEEKKA